MKQLTCEMCGGVDLLKKEGMFVCQNCQTKYSVEEAKKMMIEGTVQVTGSVSVANAGTIENFLQIAQNAYDSDNKKEAENYCNKVIEIDFQNYQAWLLKGKSAGWQTTIGNNRFSEVINCFSKAIENTQKDKLEEVKQEVSNEIHRLSIALINLACSHFADNPDNSTNAKSIIDVSNIIKNTSELLFKKCNIVQKEIENEIAKIIHTTVDKTFTISYKIYKLDNDGHPSEYAFDTFVSKCQNFIELLKISIDLSNKDTKEDLKRYELLIVISEICKKAKSYEKHFTNNGSSWAVKYEVSYSLKKSLGDTSRESAKKILEIDENYQSEFFDIKKDLEGRKEAVLKGTLKEASKDSACYIATAVYGSYNCPQVWTLRRFRDYSLAKNFFGKLFIKFYYVVSPVLVKYFGKTKIFNIFCKNILDKITAYLQKQGFSKLPYNDNNINS